MKLPCLGQCSRDVSVLFTSESLGSGGGGWEGKGRATNVRNKTGNRKKYVWYQKSFAVMR